MAKLLKRKQLRAYFATQDIDEKLHKYSKSTLFKWSASDTFDIRMALLASATLTEITQGLCWHPYEDVWLEPENVVVTSLNEVLEYEKSLSSGELRIQEFNGWE